MFPEFGTTQLTMKMPAPEKGSSARVTRSRVHFVGDGRKQMLLQNLPPQDYAQDYEVNEGLEGGIFFLYFLFYFRIFSNMLGPSFPA